MSDTPVIESPQTVLPEATQKPDSLSSPGQDAGVNPVLDESVALKASLFETMKRYGQLFVRHVEDFLREEKSAMVDAVIDRGFLKVTPKYSPEESNEVERYLKSVTIKIFDRWLTQRFSIVFADGISANRILDKTVFFEDRIFYFAQREEFNLTIVDGKIRDAQAVFALLFSIVEVCENHLALNAAKTMTAGIASDNPFVSRSPYQFNQGFPKFLKEKILHISDAELVALGNTGRTGFNNFCQETYGEFCNLQLTDFEEFLQCKAASARRDLQNEWEILTSAGFTSSDLATIADSSSQLELLTYLESYQLAEPYSWLEACLAKMSKDNFLYGCLQAIIESIRQECKPDLSSEKKIMLLETLNQFIQTLKGWHAKKIKELGENSIPLLKVDESSSDDSNSDVDDISLQAQETETSGSAVPEIKEKVTDFFRQLEYGLSTKKTIYIAELQSICVEIAVIRLSADAKALRVAIEKLKILAKKTDEETAAEVNEYVTLVEQLLATAQDQSALYQSFFDTTELYCFVLNDNAKPFDDVYRNGIVTDHQKSLERAQLAQKEISKKILNGEESLLRIKAQECFQHIQQRRLMSLWINWLRAQNIDLESFLMLKRGLENSEISVSYPYIAHLFAYMDEVMHEGLSDAETDFLAAILRGLIHAVVRGQRLIESAEWTAIVSCAQRAPNAASEAATEEIEEDEPEEGLDDASRVNKFGHIRNLFLDFCQKFSIEHPHQSAPSLTIPGTREQTIALWGELECVFGGNKLVYEQQTAKADDLAIALAKLNSLINEKKYLKLLPPGLEEIVERYIAAVEQLPYPKTADKMYRALYETTQLYCFALNDKATATWLDETPAGPLRAIARATYAQEEIEKIWDDRRLRNEAQKFRPGGHSTPYALAMMGCYLLISAGVLGVAVGVLAMLASIGTIAFAGLGTLGITPSAIILGSSISAISTGIALAKKSDRKLDQPIEAAVLAGLSVFKHQQENRQEGNVPNPLQDANSILKCSTRLGSY